METRLRLEAVVRAGFDERLLRLGGGRITRAGGVTYLETPRSFHDATRELAFGGVRVAQCAHVPVPEAGQRAAIALDLAPIADMTSALEVVEVRCVPLGEAVAILSRGRVPFLPLSQAARTSCRRLLREEDAVLAWRRVVWCSLASLRHARSSVTLRPIVFDRSAPHHGTLRWTYVSARAIERWAFP